MKEDDKKRIKKLAMLIRKKLGISQKKMPTGSTLIGLAMVKGIIKSIQVTSSNDIPLTQAQFDPENKILTITENTLSLADKHNPRAIFTIIHEIGHAVLGHKMLRNRLNNMERVHSRTLRKDETEANFFAAEFLVPEEIAEVTTKTTAEDISAKFGVSKRFAEIRLLELQRRMRIRTGEKRETPAYIQEKIDMLQSKAIIKRAPQKEFIEVGGDYKDYMTAINKQAKKYPDK